MSDTEHEDAEGTEATPEPLQGDELAPDEEEAADAEEPTSEPVEEPEQETPDGLSEKQLEAGRKKLEAEGTRHRNRVSEILGEEAQHLIPCPLCEGFVDGLIFPVLPPEDVIARTRVAIGMPDLSNYQQAKDARQCPDCAGLGVVLSGSLVAENAAINCKGCNGSGYVMITATGEITGPTVHANGGTTPELPAGVNPEDPAVKELRARGFTVFPPVQLTQG